MLIHAGAGGVGSFAIQIAALRGAEVWTTCSARNAHFCHSLGAHRTIDYTKEDFTAAGSIFDVVFDTVGGAVHSASAQVLQPHGVLVFLNAAPAHAVARNDVQVKSTEVRATQQRLEQLLAMKLRASIEARFPLAHAADGDELSRAGHARGKILLDIPA